MFLVDSSIIKDPKSFYTHALNVTSLCALTVNMHSSLARTGCWAGRDRLCPRRCAEQPDGRSRDVRIKVDHILGLLCVFQAQLAENPHAADRRAKTWLQQGVALELQQHIVPRTLHTEHHVPTEVLNRGAFGDLLEHLGVVHNFSGFCGMGVAEQQHNFDEWLRSIESSTHESIWRNGRIGRARNLPQRGYITAVTTVEDFHTAKQVEFVGELEVPARRCF
mmetsp:Transcript_37252/g.64378  ORF Transcript_37252/g.64378 Transcript_37252/m.64378 type:complete len:221 (-) Transcript_37252:364-1026(-)